MIDGETSQVRQLLGKNRVGFIGLGNMGSHMAQNLIKNGHSLVVYDIYPEAVAPLEAAGALAARSPADVADNADRIITMLPSSPHVHQVFNADNGIFKTVRNGTILIDSSTIDPALTKDLSRIAEKKGAVFVDAPVSGGVTGARDQTLTFMVGCEESSFAKVKSLLEHMGKNIVHCGPTGMGEAAKICNNMLMAIGMIGVSEAMNLGLRLGLDPKVLAGIINTSSGRCWSSEIYNPVPGIKEGTPSCTNYQGGFASSLMAKDLGLAQSAATATMSPTPLGSLAHQIYRLMMSNGMGNKDFSSVYQFLQDGQVQGEKSPAK
ncbi:LOW QUALITY PROTEIN: 3-hydroxyisobutyrate dehydrogenase, mitochondrial-like [Paramacrobiotus metropolitanus]|uniref:LOW QUALITY PROTEIN: 3-hydroxyisobutyrate dehydrogenase, mitochondrial-like n=1 Tax=Paramacrobiotus metropolitanus TaxID=2943436 RepID=UPI0024460567|nr:LOW QUALITY PROTEIN: 3-hydroxyisobutyrate dehydrogenase, mitochondrial-like [Paramacrobiotus metropolitanus]